MGKKYELTNETIEYEGRTLHRIKALKSFKENSIEKLRVTEGDLGGFIEKEYNLSQEGNAWVYNDAKVYGNAKIYEDAEIFHNAQVFENAYIYDRAKVFGNAVVHGRASVYGDAKVYDDAEVFDNANLYGNADVCNIAKVYDNAQVYGSAWIVGNQEIHGNDEEYLDPQTERKDAEYDYMEFVEGFNNLSEDAEVKEILYIVEKKLNSLEMENNKNSLSDFKNEHPELISDSKYNNLLNRLSEDWCLFDAVSYSHNLNGINDIYMKATKNYPDDEFRVVKAECIYNDHGIASTDYDYQRLEVLSIEDIYKQILGTGSIVLYDKGQLMYVNSRSDSSIEAYKIYPSEKVPQYAQNLKINDGTFHDKNIVFDTRYWLKINSIKGIKGTLLAPFTNKVCNIVDYLSEKNLIKDYSNSPIEKIKNVLGFHMDL